MTASLSMGKRLGESLKAAGRILCRPMLPILPDSLTNRMPFLGRVCIEGPKNLRLRLHTYGPHGKDRIAIKLARRGFWGYEGETLRVFLMLVESAQTVIDIGANTGLFALLAAKANPRCRVWAFEPVPFIFDMLQANVQLNQLSNIEGVQLAVSDTTEETKFFVTHTHVGIPTDSSSCPGFRSDVEELRLPATSLDDFADRHTLDRIDVLKIDTEATESKVIRGATRTIAKHRPFVICEVLENVDHAFLQGRMHSLEYQFFHVTPNCLVRHYELAGSLAVDHRNYLFVPREKAGLVANLCETAGLKKSG